MARTTTEQVVLVLGDDYDGVTSLDTAIEMANRLTNRLESAVEDWEDNWQKPGAGDLEAVERYLAAHYYATSDRPFQSARTGDASGTFQGKTGMYLDSTYYGQMAIMNDPSGYLKAWGNSDSKGTLRGGLSWLGKKPSEQINYYDRD